jgi:5-methylcytosine-specific restriction endonuclease McrA
MINLPVLVLNQNYEPLQICRVRRAIVLLYQGKAEMLENGVGYIQTAADSFPIPSVIRLAYIIKRPRPVPKLTRQEIFNRDNHTCQYCGQKVKALTIDHIIPRYRGGQHTWENVVAACPHCNRRKAGRTPEEAGMRLLSHPVKPRYRHLSMVERYRNQPTAGEWQKYLPERNN